MFRSTFVNVHSLAKGLRHETAISDIIALLRESSYVVQAPDINHGFLRAA